MFVVSNIVAVLRIFHVLFPIWILLCFVASSHNLLMAHMVFFGWREHVTGGPQWRIGIQNYSCNCSVGIVLTPPAECFWAGEIETALGLLFEVVTACTCCAEITIISHVISRSRKWCCDWSIAEAGRWRHRPALKAKYLLKKKWFGWVGSWPFCYGPAQGFFFFRRWYCYH